MATWPAKINYATGDVLTAAQMNDIGGELNDLYNARTNPVLNSNLSIWQRGTSISATASNAYTGDRWQLAANTSQTCTVSRQATGDTTNLPNIQYCARVQRNSGQNATGAYALAQSFESVNSIPFAGKTVALSFYARAGSNFSSASSNMLVQLYSGTGTDQNLLTGFTGSTVVAQNTTTTLTTTWQRFTITGTVAATATQLGIYFNATPTGTASTNDYFEITGVQLDIGSVALPYKPNASTQQGELAACQRYYYRTSNMGDFTLGTVISGTQVQGYVYHPVTMRTTPTVFDGSNIYYYDSTAATQYTTGTASSPTSSVNGGYIRYTHGTSVLTQGRAGILYMNGYYGFGAEL